MRTYVTWFYIT